MKRTTKRSERNKAQQPCKQPLEGPLVMATQAHARQGVVQSCTPWHRDCPPLTSSLFPSAASPSPIPLSFPQSFLLSFSTFLKLLVILFTLHPHIHLTFSSPSQLFLFPSSSICFPHILILLLYPSFFSPSFTPTIPSSHYPSSFHFFFLSLYSLFCSPFPYLFYSHFPLYLLIFYLFLYSLLLFLPLLNSLNFPDLSYLFQLNYSSPHASSHPLFPFSFSSLPFPSFHLFLLSSHLLNLL